ncbi:MAG: hypothetical protein HQ517_13605 [SAR324 cluster bacterium]|nr:hypothetical protein [SAR324 cluster bacterium]
MIKLIIIIIIIIILVPVMMPLNTFITIMIPFGVPIIGLKRASRDDGS